MGSSKGRMGDRELRRRRQRRKKRVKERAQEAKLSPRKK